MILDPDDFATSVSIMQPGKGWIMQENWLRYLDWATQNSIPAQMSFGRMYFKKEEHAMLFRLKFGL